ncbi:MAG: 2,4-dihydroxyhept-2-ene-1,7-dioic acid aldolase [Candidatus Lokiarchaeota archaeon]|nr:2,4-dihydroxyhept-2-ene-1,7-dioic acid aldolase [Candidatus Lokiarchaeota archaeon]
MTSIFAAMKNCMRVARLPTNDVTWIHRVLDAGADAIIVPMVNTKEEAQRAINAAKYPPQGERTFGYCRANNYGDKFNEYVQKANKNISIVLQIEHYKAIENIEDILSVPGIDATFIGPYDLSGSLGNPGDFNSIKFLKCLDSYLRASEHANIPPGMHIVRPNTSNVYNAVNSGYRFIALGIDTLFLMQQAKKSLNYLSIKEKKRLVFK